MPSVDLFSKFNNKLKITQRWLIDGTHYEKTARDWLKNQDAHKAEILSLFRGIYGEADANKWFQRWRAFYLACAELFGYDQGQEWMVAHYLFEKTDAN